MKKPEIGSSVITIIWGAGEPMISNGQEVHLFFVFQVLLIEMNWCQEMF